MQSVMESSGSSRSSVPRTPMERAFLPSTWLNQAQPVRRRATIFAVEASAGALIGLVVGSFSLWSHGKTSLALAFIGTVATGIGMRAVVRLSRLRRRFMSTTAQSADETSLANDPVAAVIGKSLLLSLAALGLITTALAYRQKAQKAEAAERRATEQVTIAVQKAEKASAEAAHLVATLETEPDESSHTTSFSGHGFVYLGMCDETWHAPTFDNLPPCRGAFPQGGVTATAKKGIKVRSALPQSNRFAEAVTRLPSGKTVHFVAIHPMVFTQPVLPGPHVYWGEIQLPN